MWILILVHFILNGMLFHWQRVFDLNSFVLKFRIEDL